MERALRMLYSLFSKPPENTCGPEAMDGMSFRQRYQIFRNLLAANTRVLDVMADMETLLREARPFGMATVRSHVTTALVNVFRMILALDQLAPKKYTPLLERFHEAQARIEGILNSRPEHEDGRMILALEEVGKTDADLVGGKMANLGEIRNRLGIAVPHGFCITARAGEIFLDSDGLRTEINRRIQAAEPDDIPGLHRLSQGIQALVMAARVPDDLARAIQDAVSGMVARSPAPLALAFRSSAVGEDRAGVSFAGMYKSLLNIAPGDALGAYRQVMAGRYSLTALNYRLNRGFRDEDNPMSVGCIAMVDAHASGVLYTRNPFDTHDDSLFIHSALGLPVPVVDGSGAADLFVVSRGEAAGVVHQEIRSKTQKYVCRPGENGCGIEVFSQGCDTPSLTHHDIDCLVSLALEMETHYGSPLDIEWAVTAPPQSRIFILQCRPLVRSETLRRGSADGKMGSRLARQYPVLAQGGTTASPGTASGRVFQVNTQEDLTRFPKGAVLVASHALARWAPVLSRAAALVTAQGSFAGHLANVAREFNVPAVFNLDGDIDRLKSGDLVTVDADNGLVYKGRVQALLSQTDPSPRLMQGSPVYRLLESTGKEILPLNLLDPDSIAFRAENCKTLHDMTRFIHERSVKEMFRHGKEQGKDCRAAKQLYDQRPLKWWILNLDDGFNREVAGRYVHLEEIASRPMLAVWEGIAAFPWEGPPPIDTRGFMSVMFRATTNTALNTGQRTKYADRNFFIISKAYCSLSSRLGFHFTTVEAYAGPRSPENHIVFRFQGGAADFERRLARVRFVGEFLDEYGFESTVKQDNLTARIRGGTAEFILDRLRVLGYLIIHTRQLDMVMANARQIQEYRERFKRDIREIMTQGDGPP